MARVNGVSIIDIEGRAFDPFLFGRLLARAASDLRLKFENESRVSKFCVSTNGVAQEVHSYLTADDVT